MPRPCMMGSFALLRSELGGELGWVRFAATAVPAGQRLMWAQLALPLATPRRPRAVLPAALLAYIRLVCTCEVISCQRQTMAQQECCLAELAASRAPARSRRHATPAPDVENDRRARAVRRQACRESSAVFDDRSGARAAQVLGVQSDAFPSWAMSCRSRPKRGRLRVDIGRN